MVTGATRGLGRAMTVEFIKRGYAVAGCGTSPENVDALNKAYGAPHSFAVVDVRDGRAMRLWADAVLAKHNPPQILINNAGVVNRNESVWEIGEEEFAWVVDVNLKGIANSVRAFVPAMIDKQKGIIVNMSSGWGRSATPEMGPYCASKWAVDGLTQSLAMELPEGMAAVALDPGVVNTRMLRSCFGEAAAEYPGPEEWVTSAVPYLLHLGPSDNGQILTIPSKRRPLSGIGTRHIV